jgi:hypothetical protein
MEQALHRANFPAAGDLSNDQRPDQWLQGESKGASAQREYLQVIFWQAPISRRQKTLLRKKLDGGTAGWHA